MAATPRTTSEQRAVLIEFMEKYDDLARPQEGPQGREKIDQFWEKLTKELNAIGGGAIKSCEQWKKVWIEMKTKAKRKATQTKSATGGGPSVKLSLIDQRVLAIMGFPAVDGLAGIREQNSIPLPVERVPSQNTLSVSEPTTSALPQSATPSSVAPTNQHQNPPAATFSPSSTATSPQHRPPSISRRGMTETGFERACNEFAAIEQRRLQQEEAQERRLHERETERLRLEARRIEVQHENNQLLHRLADIGDELVDVLSKK